MRCATTRATTSTAEPAANGLIRVTGRVGQSVAVCACTLTIAMAGITAAAAARANFLRKIFIVSLLVKY